MPEVKLFASATFTNGVFLSDLALVGMFLPTKNATNSRFLLRLKQQN